MNFNTSTNNEYLKTNDISDIQWPRQLQPQPHERSQSQKPQLGSKQVRFDIKQGLKNLIEENNLEIDSIANRSQSLSKVKENSSINKSKMQNRSQQSKSPSVKEKKNDKDDKSQKSDRSDKSQKQYKSRKLALKYKRQAEESRMKKQGGDNKILIQEKNTPNFSKLIDTSSFQGTIGESPERVQQPPRPLEIKPSLELIEQSERKPKNYKPKIQQYNEPQIVSTPQIQPRVAGSIVKSNNIRESSQNPVIKQVGMIVRQRSTSPGDALSLGRNKENLSMMMNTSVLAGQIVKIQNQRLNQTQQQIQINKPDTVLSPKIEITEKPKHQFHANENQQQQIPIQIQETIPKQQQKLQKQEPFKVIAVWNLIGQSPDYSKQYISSLKVQSSINQSRKQLLEQLSRQPLYYPGNFSQLFTYSKDKLHSLVTNLQNIYQQSVYEKVLEIIDINERRVQRQNDLKRTIKEYAKKKSASDLLKTELLKDIVSRLTQKIVVHLLRLNSELKSQLRAQFNTYYQEYIARDYLKLCFQQMKKCFEKNQEKTQYQNFVKEKTQQVRIQQIFYAWKNIRHYQRQNQERIEEASRILTSRKTYRLIAEWKIAIIKKRNLELGNTLAVYRNQYKNHKLLFLRWVLANRQQSKIKRKALQMLSAPQSKQQKCISTFGDEQWFKEQKHNIEEGFFNSIKDILLEREHNHSFILALKYKLREEELNNYFPLHLKADREFKGKSDLTLARQYNEYHIYNNYPELRLGSQIHQQHQTYRPVFKYPSNNQVITTVNTNSKFDSPIRNENLVSQSLDLDLKYSIHSALVLQQNTQQKNYQGLERSHSFISQQKSEIKSSVVKRLLPPMPQRLVNLEKNQQQSVIEQLPPPNRLFQKLETQIQQLNGYKPNQSFTYDTHCLLPFQIQLKEHILKIKKKIRTIESQNYSHYFAVSLKQNASDILDSDSISGLTDYIQYGISADQSRMVFIRMFQTKAMSILFTKWKVRFMKQQLDRILPELHTLQLSKQAFTEWNKVKLTRQYRIREFSRTNQLQRFYKLFRNWAKWNREKVHSDNEKIRVFRQGVIFQNWLKYLDSQGEVLVRILRAQSYFKQALMSKAMLSLYQNYLKSLRIKRFSRQRIMKKYFQHIWIQKYKQSLKLKSVLQNIEKKCLLSERLRFQREFEIKKEVLVFWKDRVGDKQRLIHHYQALTHYRHQLQFKSFSTWKTTIQYKKGLSILMRIPRNAILQPTFQLIKSISNQLQSSQVQYQNYSKIKQKTQIFQQWKEQYMKSKLAKMFYQKLIIKHWNNYIHYRNYQLTYDYREKRLKKLFFEIMKEELKSKWNEQRSKIILRQLQKKQKQKLMKMVFLKLLENILVTKKQRIIESTVHDFRAHYMMSKTYKALKRVWLRRTKERLMNRVAKDFYQKILKRRELKLKQYYQSQGLQYIQTDKVLLNRVMNTWRMFILNKIKNRTVTKRFRMLKQRSKLLKCFLAWRQQTLYEQSLTNTYRSYYTMPQQIHSPPTNQKIMPSNAQQMMMFNQNSSKSIIDNRKMNEIIGSGDITQVMPLPSESPFKLDDNPQQEKSLFDELENIFQKNKKWLDEQKEREDFLRDMAAQYNQRLSQEMSTLRYSTDKFNTLSSKGAKYK